jgi:hypothetical protein
MWVIAGYSFTGSNNDVWTSVDGVTWNKVLGDGPASATHFCERWGISTAVYNNAMWVMTGAYALTSNADPATVYSDVWTSASGSSWTEVSATNIFDDIYFPFRFGHLSLSFNNSLWVIGGCDNICQTSDCAITYLNDVWYTQ